MIPFNKPFYTEEEGKLLLAEYEELLKGYNPDFLKSDDDKVWLSGMAEAARMFQLEDCLDRAGLHEEARALRTGWAETHHRPRK